MLSVRGAAPTCAFAFIEPDATIGFAIRTFPAVVAGTSFLSGSVGSEPTSVGLTLTVVRATLAGAVFALRAPFPN